MKKSRFTEDQIAYALKQAKLGTSVEEVCRKMGISDATFYVWRKKYQNLGPSEVRRLRQREEENRKLKQIVADLSLDKAIRPPSSQHWSTAAEFARQCRPLPATTIPHSRKF